MIRLDGETNISTGELPEYGRLLSSHSLLDTVFTLEEDRLRAAIAESVKEGGKLEAFDTESLRFEELRLDPGDDSLLVIKHFLDRGSQVSLADPEVGTLTRFYLIDEALAPIGATLFGRWYTTIEWL